MQINVDVKGIDELLKKLDPKKIGKGIQAALNRTAKSGKTEISSQLREKWNLRKTDIDRKIEFKPARGSALSAIISVTGKPISLMYFGPSSVSGGIKTYASRNKGVMPGLAQKRSGGRNSGVKVKIFNTKGQTTLSKAFFTIATKGGTPLVVWRSQEKVDASKYYSSRIKNFKSRGGKYQKGKLKAYKIITLPSMFTQSKVMQAVKEKIKTQWQKEWANQIKQLQSGQGWMEK